MLFDKEIKTFCFTYGWCLYPNDVHSNYIICTVECTFHISIDVIQSLKTFYLLFTARDIPYFVNFTLVYVRL